MSSLTRSEAHAILELPIGADLDAIRTSYKRLANKWHPEKHPKSAEAMKIFQNISHAYKRLIKENDKIPMDLKEMFSLYQHTVYSNDCHNGVIDNYESDEMSDSSDDDIDDPLSLLSRGSNKLKSRRDYDYDIENNSNRFTEEERNRFADELITEEEKKKKKLEKRRIKKKQRREKKRLEKQGVEQTQKLQDEPKKNGKVKEIEIERQYQEQNSKKFEPLANSEVEETNSNTAFYTQVSKKKKSSEIETKNDSRLTTTTTIKNEELADTIVIQSRQCAIEGNNMANGGEFREAIELFSKAINLDPSDFRFYGNRSFCHERLEEFEKGLTDASKAISMAPDWPKGYFRKGKALIGLKNYTSAEDAFIHVLKLDAKCIDAKHELSQVRIQQLIEMGFSVQQAKSAIQQFETVQQALDSLLAGLVTETPILDEVYISDEEEEEEEEEDESKAVNTINRLKNNTQQQQTIINSHQKSPPTTTTTVKNNSLMKTSSNSHQHQQQQQQQKNALLPIPQHHYEQAQNQILINKQMDNVKMNPRNPEGLTSLWVGNVLPEVTQEELVILFSKFGKLQSVKCLPDKFCAFVNFTSKECAGKAMEALQGNDCGGQKLLIKFPDNPLTATTPLCVTNGTEKIAQKPTKVQQQAQPPTSMAAAAAAASKISGPVNGNECYFWRTTGCQFATSCRYRHVPDHKGIDKKPWHKSK